MLTKHCEFIKEKYTVRVFLHWQMHTHTHGHSSVDARKESEPGSFTSPRKKTYIPCIVVVAVGAILLCFKGTVAFFSLYRTMGKKSLMRKVLPAQAKSRVRLARETTFRNIPPPPSHRRMDSICLHFSLESVPVHRNFRVGFRNKFLIYQLQQQQQSGIKPGLSPNQNPTNAAGVNSHLTHAAIEILIPIKKLINSRETPG